MSEFFQSEAFQSALDILIHQFPLAIWETVYVTILSTFFAVVIGLPLGVLPSRANITASCASRSGF